MSEFKSTLLIPLSRRARGSHNDDSDNNEPNSYHLQNTYYAPGTRLGAPYHSLTARWADGHLQVELCAGVAL